MTAADVNRTILAVWRIEQPRLLTSLSRMLRDVPLAEDLTQEALLAAIEHWPVTGVPEKPGAWLMAIAKRRAIDLIRRKVADVETFIAVSDYYVPVMARLLAIAESKIRVVPLGINMNGYQKRPAAGAADGVFRVGYFARIAPEKGLHVLADAYIRLRKRTGPAAMRLEAAGYLAPAHRRYLAEVEDTLRAAGLDGEFAYHGAVDRDAKLAFLQSLDVFSVPAPYDEPKGVFLLEAMASGVPAVQPRRGAFTEIVQTTGGGLLVAPDDPGALADALHTLWADRAYARTVADRAFDGVRRHYSIGRSADRLLEVYDAVAARAAGRSADDRHLAAGH
jgi:glycosyltransferase involved in cell wall biosynthesis